MLGGAFGSALHNALFAPADAKVIGLNRINAVQERIADLRGQHVTFVKPASGEWVMWGPREKSSYVIDILRLKDVLTRMLEI